MKKVRTTACDRPSMRILKSKRKAVAIYQSQFIDLRKHGMYFSFIQTRKRVVMQVYW